MAAPRAVLTRWKQDLVCWKKHFKKSYLSLFLPMPLQAAMVLETAVTMLLNMEKPKSHHPIHAKVEGDVFELDFNDFHKCCIQSSCSGSKQTGSTVQSPEVMDMAYYKKFFYGMILMSKQACWPRWCCQLLGQEPNIVCHCPHSSRYV